MHLYSTFTRLKTGKGDRKKTGRIFCGLNSGPNKEGITVITYLVLFPNRCERLIFEHLAVNKYPRKQKSNIK